MPTMILPLTRKHRFLNCKYIPSLRPEGLGRSVEVGSSGVPPPKQVFPYSIGGPRLFRSGIVWGGGGGGVVHNQNPPLPLHLSTLRQCFLARVLMNKNHHDSQGFVIGGHAGDCPSIASSNPRRQTGSRRAGRGEAFKSLRVSQR